MENSHCLDISIETTDEMIIDAIEFIRISKKRQRTLSITDHIVKTEQGSDQLFLEKKIAYLTENGVLENIPSHGKDYYPI